MNQRAFQIVQETTGLASPPDLGEGKDAAAVALGRKGGRKGGKARAAAMTAEQRREIARKAANTRWSKE